MSSIPSAGVGPAGSVVPGQSAAQRLAFLAAAGELLSSSLDYKQTLQHVARLAVPALGDLCMVDVVEDGRLRRVGTAHVLPHKSALLEQLARNHPVLDGSPAPAARVLDSGRAELLETVTPELIASHTVDAEHARLITAIGIHSHVAVPMRARGVIVGVISIGITESDRKFVPEDTVLAEALAGRAALAVDNARLYQAAQQELEKRRLLEENLRQSERRFRAIIEQSPLSTQILAPDGSTLGVNEAWRKLWGISLEDLAAYNLLDDPQLHAAGVTPLLKRAFAGESVELPTIAYDLDQNEPLRERSDREKRWVKAFAYPVKGDSGVVEEVILLHEDVTVVSRSMALLRSSEDRLQRALSIDRLNVWDWDLLTDDVTCSENALEFWGIQVGNATDLLDVVHPDDLAGAREAARASIEDGAPYRLEFRLCSPDGGLRWAESRGRVEYDATGKPVRFLGMTRDITEQKRAEDATRVLADAGAALGDSLDYQITLGSLAKVVVPTLADWFAVDLLTSEGELERVSVSHPDPLKIALAQEMHRRYPPQREDPGSAWCVIKSGQPDWAELITDQQLEQAAKDADHLALLRSLKPRSYIRVPLTARGATIGLLTLVFAESGRRYRPADVDLATDLARRAAVAVDNARLLQELQLADRRKDEFLAMLAHELRNPLAPISMAAQLLKMSAGESPRVLSASEIISRQVAHMTELVDDLLDVSRVTRGLVQLERHPVDIKTVMAAAVEQVQSLMETKRHVLGISTGAPALIVEGDRARLIQVVANLLNNAAKYSPPGGAIELGVDAFESRIRLTVRDQGAGIDSALLPHVFDLFTQAQRTPDRTQGGLGLGLALVKSIVQLHGGEVSAHSAGPGRGSTFTVLLPLAQQAEVAQLMNPAPSVAAPASLRIMLVDDNEDAAAVLAAVLRIEGHQVCVAHTATRALALAELESGLQVFILDIGLPDMTGYELASKLLARADAANAVFIALTGYGQAQDRRQSSAAGFHHHLVKPANPQDLLDLLSGLPSG